MVGKRVLLGAATALGWCVAGWMAGCSSTSFSGTDGTDAATTDSSADGPGTDGGDAQPPDASVPFFCTTLAPAPFFCADFDETDLRTGYENGGSVFAFSQPTPSDAGSYEATPDGKSLPNAVTIRLPSLVASDREQVDTTVSLAADDTAQHFLLTADVRLDEVGDISASNYLYLMSLQLKGDLKNTLYSLVIHNSQLFLGIGDGAGTTYEELLLGAVPGTGTWLPFSLDLTLGATGKLRVSLGEEVNTTMSYTELLQQQPSLTIGLQSSGGTGVFAVSFDDLVLQADVGDAGDGG